MRDWRKKPLKRYIRMLKHICPDLCKCFSFPKKMFSFPKFDSNALSNPCDHFSVKQFLCKSNLSPEIYQIIRSGKGGVNVDGLDAIYEPGGG